MANETKTDITADAELQSLLTGLKEELGTLRADIDTIKADGLALGRAGVRTAQRAALQARDEAAARVRTLEEDAAEIASDLGDSVRRNPLTSIGLAVLGGMLLSRALSSKD